MAKGKRAGKGLPAMAGAAMWAALIIGTMLAFPLWMHHDVREESPMFRTEAQAQAWVEALERGEAETCIESTRDKKVIEQAYDGGWFVEYACNTPRSYVRLALGYAIPALLVFMLAALSAPRRKS